MILEGDWSVGIVDCLFSKHFSSIRKGDMLFAVDFQIEYRIFGSRIWVGHASFIPRKTINAQSVDTCLVEYEKDIRSYLVAKELLTDKPIFKRGVKDGPLLFPPINPLDIPQIEYKDIVVTWKFAPSARLLLGIDSDVTCTNFDMYSCPNIPRLVNSIKYIAVYSDLVGTSYMGDTEANILDMIPLEDVHSKRGNHIIYKPVKRSTVDSISIDLRDQKGDAVSFIDGESSVAILHFKKM
jgi:hypothetical protein